MNGSESASLQTLERSLYSVQHQGIVTGFGLSALNLDTPLMLERSPDCVTDTLSLTAASVAQMQKCRHPRRGY